MMLFIAGLLKQIELFNSLIDNPSLGFQTFCPKRETFAALQRKLKLIFEVLDKQTERRNLPRTRLVDVFSPREDVLYIFGNSVDNFL